MVTIQSFQFSHGNSLYFYSVSLAKEVNQLNVVQDRTVITDDFLSVHPSHSVDGITTSLVVSDESSKFSNLLSSEQKWCYQKLPEITVFSVTVITFVMHLVDKVITLKT